MGYFTEAMALFEFKSDIRADYAMKRNKDIYSGSHGGKQKERFDKIYDEYEKSSSGASNMKQYKKHNKYANSRADAAEGLADANSRRREMNKELVAAKGKSCKESFSEAFDSIAL